MNNDDLFYGEKTPEPSNNQQSGQSSNPQGNPYMQGGQGGQQGQGSPYNWGDPYGYNPQPPVNESNPLAVISLICGIISLCCCFCPVITPIAAIAGIITAICSKRNQPMKGMAIAGLVTSIIGLVIAVIFIVYLFYIGSMMSNPEFLRSFFQQLESMDPDTYNLYKDMIKDANPELYKQIFEEATSALIRLIHLS